jgi:hypothetical protein
MSSLAESADMVRRFRAGHVLLVAVAIFGLTSSLATRTFRLTIPQGVNVQSNSPQAIRQHLDRDAVRWFPPVFVLILLQAPAFHPGVAPSVLPLRSFHFAEALHKRPPPFFSC